MILDFAAGGHGGWIGKISEARLYIADQDGAANAAQIVIAKWIAENLPALQTKATDYLDLFVDRGKVCGDRTEQWWLDEIDFREGSGEYPITYSLSFTLNGDDGGIWTVDMRAFDWGHLPFRFERRQG